MEFLKGILGEDLYNQVAEKLKGNDKVKLVNIADGSYVEKSVYDAEIQKAKEEAASVPDGKSLVDTSEFETLKADKDKLDKDLKQHKFDSAVALKATRLHLQAMFTQTRRELMNLYAEH